MKEGIELTKKTLAAIKLISLKHHPQTKVAWTKAFADLAELQVLPSTYIVICGMTGAGKSSLLNALLGYSFLPTSSMKACTSVVVEISHHEDQNSFVAEVWFMSQEEWMEDMKSLAGEVEGETANLGVGVEPCKEVRLAWQKLCAVYSHLDLRLDKDFDLGDLVERCKDVSANFGQVKYISARDPKTFAEAIAPYIDSRDVSMSRREERQQSLWPLIKLVKIRCAAPVLRTGAILVDLPGLGDRSAAREAVTRDYIKEAKYIWVAASITRAVDDNVAKELLGDQFRSQLMNGNYSDQSVSFILTQTDNAVTNDLANELGLKHDPTYLSICSRIEACSDDSELKEAENERFVFATNKRSEWSRKELQSQFREGLREADEFRVYSLDPENFDSTTNLRDYRKVNLPVFACSALGFRQLIDRQESTYRDVICFRRKRDTGIPALRQHGLLLASLPRDKSMHEYFTSFKHLLDSIESHATRPPDSNRSERESLRKLWSSKFETCHKNCPVSIFCRKGGDQILDDALVMFNKRGMLAPQEHSRICIKFREGKHYARESVGIASRFTALATEACDEVRRSIELKIDQRLKPACRAGASRMSVRANAGMTSAGRNLKWNTYANVLRNNGVWKNHDLNFRLVLPGWESIGPIWEDFFETDYFDDLEAKLVNICEDLLKEMVDSASSNLRDCCDILRQRAMHVMRSSIQRAFEKARNAINYERKISSTAPYYHVRAQLRPKYKEAASYKGVGAFIKQKKTMEEFVSSNKAEIFTTSFEKVFEKLDAMLDKIWNAVQFAIIEMGEKVEHIMSEVWEYTVSDEKQRAARTRLAAKIELIHARVNNILSGLEPKASATAQDLQAEASDFESLKI